jgi:hypothetical protein
VSQVNLGRLWLRPTCNHGSALINQDRTVRLDKVMEHRSE